MVKECARLEKSRDGEQFVMNRISIVIPYYNVKKEYVDECLASILSQNFADFEIIIVDDGSEDSYKSSLCQYANHEKIKIISQENSGVSSARNTGIRISTGDFLLFADADDVLVANCLQEMMTLQEQTDADVVIGGNIRYEGNESFKNQSGSFDYQIWEGKEVALLKPQLIGNTRKFGTEGGYIGRGPWTRLIKSKVVKSILFDGTLSQGEDILWNLMLLKAASRVCVADRVWYKYRHNYSSATHRYNPRILESIEKELNRLKEEVDFNNDSEFRAYSELLIHSLFKAYKCYLFNMKGTEEIVEKRRHVYHNSPWTDLKNPRAGKLLLRKQNIYRLLYTRRILFLFLDFKYKNL